MIVARLTTLWMYKRVVFGAVVPPVADMTDIILASFWFWLCSPLARWAWGFTRNLSLKSCTARLMSLLRHIAVSKIL